MAYKGKTIFNSKTKIETKFLQTSKDTNGQLLEMETTYPARSSHRHIITRIKKKIL